MPISTDVTTQQRTIYRSRQGDKDWVLSPRKQRDDRRHITRIEINLLVPFPVKNHGFLLGGGNT